MSSRYIMFGAPRFGRAERAELIDSGGRGWIGTGPKVQHLERAFRAYLGVPHSERTVSLPLSSHLSDNDVERVVFAGHDILT